MMSNDKTDAELSGVPRNSHKLNLALYIMVNKMHESPKSKQYLVAVQYLFTSLDVLVNLTAKSTKEIKEKANRLNIILNNATLEEWEALLSAAAADSSPEPMINLLLVLKRLKTSKPNEPTVRTADTAMQTEVLEENFALLLNYAEQHPREIVPPFIDIFVTANQDSVDALTLTDADITRLIVMGIPYQESAKRLMPMLINLAKIRPFTEANISALINLAELNQLVPNLLALIGDVAKTHPLSDQNMRTLIMLAQAKNLENRLFPLLESMVPTQALSDDNLLLVVALAKKNPAYTPKVLQILMSMEKFNATTFIAAIKDSPAVIKQVLDLIAVEHKAHRHAFLDALGDDDVRVLIAAAAKDTTSGIALLKCVDALKGRVELLKLAESKDISTLMGIASDEYPEGIAVLLDVVSPQQALSMLVQPINPTLVSNNENVMFYSLIHNPTAIPALLSKVMSIDGDDARVMSTCALTVRNVYENQENKTRIGEYNKMLTDVVFKNPAAKRAFLLMLFAYDLDKLKRKAMVDPNPAYLLAHEKAQQLFGVLRREFERVATQANPLTTVEKAEMRQRCMVAINENKTTILDAARSVTGLESILTERFTRIIGLVTEMTAETPKPSQGGMFGAKHSAAQAAAQAEAHRKGIDSDEGFRL